LPEGFVLRADFLEPDEERAMLDFIRTLSYGVVVMRGMASRRRVAQFGFRYDFEPSKLAPGTPLPEELRGLRNRSAAFAGVAAEEFAEALVTEYPPGAGIGWHKDARPFGVVAGISLGSACRMRFQMGKGSDRVAAAVELPPRSIYLLTGDARTKWEHSIPAVKVIRWSVTYRTIKGLRD
jgi:alkylated DNA repair dioxygenase AlkB